MSVPTPETKSKANIENISKIVQSNFPESDIEVVLRAYDLADRAHAGVVRKTGEPYIRHCLETAYSLAIMRLDPPTIAAGLLHDVPEDTDYTIEQVEEEFGSEIAQLVDGVTKLGQIDKLSHHKDRTITEAHQAENLRKMFLAMGADIRVVLIKLADRLHNMRTLWGVPRNKQIRIARETMDIFAPLANRLGIWQIKWELEDLCLYYLEPDIYQEIKALVAERREDRDKYVDKVTRILQDQLEKENIKAEISGRSKHIYSIYRKMLQKGRDYEHIYDVRAVRVIVNDVRDCYHVLGLVHAQWTPIPGEFDDYIANPKENNYQSLHTAVVGPGGKTLEVQIRTHEMHYVAEFGVAAHWRYKEHITGDKALEARIASLRSLIDWRQDMADAKEFVDSLKTDILPDRVFVFTPKGEIIDLPAGATPLDFAYRIHTEVGHRCRGAKIDGKMVPFDYQLKDGDQVEIVTTKRSRPSRDWLNPHLGYVKTSRARAKIRGWFRKQDRKVNIAQGRELLENELKKMGMKQENFERLANLASYDKVDDFLAAIGYGDISPQTLAAKALELKETEVLPEPALAIGPRLPTVPRSKESADVSINGVGNMLTRLAGCCNPLPGDAIMGYITLGHGVSIHRQTCPNILNKEATGRLIEVKWRQTVQQVHSVIVEVLAWDRSGLFSDIANIVAREDVNMSSAHVSTNKQDHSALITATLEITDVAQLSRLLNKISQLPNVVDVHRQTG
ncbi:MAG: bifunctional (p)ppGpp synthetase/guanosine-3',5'-bis(diphosphate) 3'-pyrophosphohydrolase [Chloroflexi bacterium]|nr:bifunctional (p)ppGpp synthetase/guanosine-3',5'-bis(diphosphate) 3'-pyrophosphohydrolase [Chloroflexota bacterium]